MLLLGSVVALNAQSVVGVTHQNQVYNDGDTITVTVYTDAESYDGIGLKNQSNSRLEGLVVTLTQETEGGIEIYATCTGEVCIPGLVSNPIDIAIRGSYNSLIFDFYNNYPDNVTPTLYTMNVANANVSTTVVLKFRFEGVGIGQPVFDAKMNAFPNPCDGRVGISYTTEGPATLVVYDMQGRTVRQQGVSGEGTVYIDGLASGIYTYGLTTATSRSVLRKLVVK